LRPRCKACAANKHKDRSVIEHPAEQETQWDWLELPDPPRQWGLDGPAHLIEGPHQIATRLRIDDLDLAHACWVTGGADEDARSGWCCTRRRLILGACYLLHRGC
jgi:hypothetical protein